MQDPIVRCNQCSKLVHTGFIAEHGGCHECGNRRFKNVTGISGEEMKQLRAGRFDFGGAFEVPDEYLDDWAEAGTFEPKPDPAANVVKP